MLSFIKKNLIIYLEFLQNKKTSARVHDREWKEYYDLYDDKTNNEIHKKILKLLNEECYLLKDKIVNQFEFINFLKKKLKHPLNEYTMVDVGSGCGPKIWNIGKYFNKIISIEPSKYGIALQKKIFKDKENIEYFNDYAGNFFENFQFKKPVIIFSSVVFFHLKDKEVISIFKKFNELPKDSCVILNETYAASKKKYLYLQHYREKNFFLKYLKKYDLEFLDNKHEVLRLINEIKEESGIIKQEYEFVEGISKKISIKIIKDFENNNKNIRFIINKNILSIWANDYKLFNDVINFVKKPEYGIFDKNVSGGIFGIKK